MAGQPLERGAEISPSLLSRPPLERIGSYYLASAIQEGNRLGGISSDISRIQDALREGMHGELPRDLIQRFMFQDLTWLSNFDVNLPLFFWGVKGHIAPHTLGPGPRFAVATIEIARKSIPKRGINRPVVDDREPIFVRIAGVQQEGRVIALTYDATSSMDLRYVNISLADDEVRRAEEHDAKLSDVTIDEGRFENNTATSLTDPYRDAGFITEPMMYHPDTIIPPHHRLLKIPASTLSTNQGITHDPRGFLIHERNGMYVIGICRPGSIRDVIIPPRLTPTQVA